mmetsp:Transcript_46966/g.69533  ORF Transcript_46966/g.69533 Transcript_46966/m.69533 type:complete len:117 (-) Transcript_46966:2343-2693(-)
MGLNRNRRNKLQTRRTLVEEFSKGRGDMIPVHSLGVPKKPRITPHEMCAMARVPTTTESSKHLPRMSILTPFFITDANDPPKTPITKKHAGTTPAPAAYTSGFVQTPGKSETVNAV